MRKKIKYRSNKKLSKIKKGGHWWSSKKARECEIERERERAEGGGGGGEPENKGESESERGRAKKHDI
jgi:hypothetical protein